MIQEIHLNTVGGASNVLAVEIDTNEAALSYWGETTQSGVNPPTTTNLSKNTLGAVSITRPLMGEYEFDFPLAVGGKWNCYIGQPNNVTLGFNANNFIGGTIGTTVKVKSQWNDAGTPKEIDGVLQDTFFRFDYFVNAITDSEEMFNAVISKLDVNQLELWTKIVIRFNNDVIEVYGNKYRKLGTYAGSFKVINS